LELNAPIGPIGTGAGTRSVCAAVYCVEADSGSGEVGNASSEDGNGAAEEGKLSGAVLADDSGREGKGSDDTEVDGPAEEADGSASDGNTSGSIDSCAWTARAAEKKTPASNGSAGQEIFRLILPMRSVAVPGEKATRPRVIHTKPDRMRARLEWRHKHVNQKISVKE